MNARTVSILTFGLVLLASANATLPRSTQREQIPIASGEIVLEIHDPKILDAIEARGYTLGDFLGAKGSRATADLILPISGGSSAYAQIVEFVKNDVTDVRRSLQRNGFKETRDPNDNESRVLDTNWLTSKFARYELIGIVNRYDRKDFGNANCGEVRFLYRLAYTTTGPKPSSSRLPFSFNLVLEYPKPSSGNCVEFAQAWRTPSTLTTAAATADWLSQFPLRASSLLKLKQLELNAQVVRNVSGGLVQPGGEKTFGGQAIYLQRIFSIDRAEPTGPITVRTKKLENTIDPSQYAGRPERLAALRQLIVQNLAAIDQGTYVFPEEWLTDRVFSFSTFGSARLANRPFAQVIRPTDLGTLDFSKTRFLNSNAAVIERLDNQTCVGCHQSGSTAGFHFLGFDRVSTNPLNQVKIGMSPHFYAETFRRRAYLSETIAGRTPDRFRPISGAPAANWTPGSALSFRTADITQVCVPRAARSAFKMNWTCGSLADDGTTAAAIACRPLANNAQLDIPTGQCQMTEEKRVFSGHPCKVGDVVTGSFELGDENVPMHLKDTFVNLQTTHAFAPRATPTETNCRPPAIGVPGGLSYRQCGASDKSFARFRTNLSSAEIPNDICGAVGGTSFDACVASGNFDSCIRAATLRGMRTTCGADRFCREDYICQEFPKYIDGVERPGVKEFGFCSPTYFLFQMRIDGHPKP